MDQHTFYGLLDELFELDPGTLQARPYADPPKPKLTYAEDNERYQREMSMWGVGPEKFYWPGGFVSPTEWFGLHTPAEAERNYRIGMRVTPYSRASFRRRR